MPDPMTREQMIEFCAEGEYGERCCPKCSAVPAATHADDCWWGKSRALRERIASGVLAAVADPKYWRAEIAAALAALPVAGDATRDALRRCHALLQQAVAQLDGEALPDLIERIQAELFPCDEAGTCPTVAEDALPAAMPVIEVGDWFVLHGRTERPHYPWNVETHEILGQTRLKFYGAPLSAVEEIRGERHGKPFVWRRGDAPR